MAAASQELTVESVWETDGSESPSGPLASVTGIVVDSLGRIWVSDGRGSEIRLLDAGGKDLGVLAREGEGPGEVRGPDLIARRADDRIYVYDVGLSSIQVFSPSGDFERRVRLPLTVMWPKGFVVLPTGAFFLSGGIVSNSAAIHLFSDSGALLESWGATPTTEDPQARWIVSGGPLAGLPGGGLLYSQASPQLIVSYAGGSGAGADTVLSSTGLLPPAGDDVILHSMEDGQPVRSFRGGFPQSRGIFPLSDGRLLAVATFAEEHRSYWEIFRDDGRREAWASVPVAFRPWALANNGDVLASYRHEVTGEQRVARLRITY